MLSQSLSPAPAAPDLSKLVRGDGAPVEWAVSGGYVDYPAAVEAMEARAAAIAEFGVPADVREGRVGVWVERKGPGWSREDKIAAIGVKVRKWVSVHGISLNVEPDLTHFSGIVPCGINEHGVTSLIDLGVPATMDETDEALRTSFRRVFGMTQAATAPD